MNPLKVSHATAGAAGVAGVIVWGAGALGLHVPPVAAAAFAAAVVSLGAAIAHGGLRGVVLTIWAGAPAAAKPKPDSPGALLD